MQLIRAKLIAIDIHTAYKVFIPSQVIIEGIWGNNRASGFLAVDDVTFYDGVSIIATYDTPPDCIDTLKS